MNRAFWRFIGFLLAILMKLIFLTVRIRKFNENEAERRMDERVRTIFALWHSDLIPLMWVYRKRGIFVPVSLSRDGEIASALLRFNGYRVIRGSSTRGGLKVLRDMEGVLKKGGLLAVAVDGPKGPPHEPKRGILWLAIKCGVEVIPVVAEVKGGIRIRSWDRMKIPLPFSQVDIRFGSALRFSTEVDEGLRILKEEMNRLMGK